ncbi:hypothetical protein MRB53_042373 [Persea americana]|nr:hypothetical protein MRB53_042373 [Persea americana]
MSSSYQDELKAKADQALDIGKDAVYSHGWTYPLQGIYYTLTHNSVWKPLKSQLLPRMTLAAAVLVVLFTFAYVPQALALSFVSGPFGFITAVPIVLSEANILVNFLSVFLEDKMDLLFDTVLLDKGLTELVQHGREIRRGSGKSAATAMKAKLTSKFSRFSPEALIRYILTIPLNLIPAVGTMLFIILNGQKAGPRFLARYFQLKQYSDQVKAQQIERKTGALTAFGAMTVVLNLVPVANQLFTYTNIVGAALLAADMEAGSSKGM